MWRKILPKIKYWQWLARCMILISEEWHYLVRVFEYWYKDIWHQNVYKNFGFTQAKIKKLFVSRTQPTVRKRWDSKYFLGDLRWLFFLFFFFWLPEIVTGSSDLLQNLRSELVYILKWTKSVGRLWRNQIRERTQHLNMLKLRCCKNDD